MKPFLESFSHEFSTLLHGSACITKLADGAIWAEGPTYLAENEMLVWSDVRSDRMWSWADTDGQLIFREPSGHSNGNSVDLEGRLLTCEHSNRRVSRTETDGTIITLVDNYKGHKLNSPNDLAVKSDGTVWFTDPPYGLLGIGEGVQSRSELDGCYVFRFDPLSGNIEIASDDFDKPNGIAFSPDESLLYISDTGRTHNPQGPHHIRVFDVEQGKYLTNGRVFANIDPGVPDGFCLDEYGNLFTSAWDGVHVYSASARLLGKIRLPEKTANCTFGGADSNRLFITASSSIYAVTINSRGSR